MKKLLSIVLILFSFWGCSGTRDTTGFLPEEYFDYAMSLFNDEDYDIAVNEFQTILLQFPASTVNDDAQYYLGMTYFHRSQYLLAAYEFSKLIRDIPTSSFVPEAQFMLSESYYQLSPPFPLDQAYTKKAIEEFQAFIDFFPVNPKVDEAERKISELNNKLAEKEYTSAVIYEKMDYNKAAVEYYDVVIETYHDTKYAPLALYNKIQLELKRKLTPDALRDISEFLNRYPDDPRANEIAQLQNDLLTQ